MAGAASRQAVHLLAGRKAPRARLLEREEAMASWRAAIHNHGPATIRDFVWWSGLKVKDAARRRSAR